MRLLLNSLPKSGTSLAQKLLRLADIRYSGKSIAASSLFGKNVFIKRLLRQPGLSELPVPIGLDVPVCASPSWLHRYLQNADGYVSGHAAYSDHFFEVLQDQRYLTIQAVRHPAAVIVSWANYIIEPGYYWNSASVAMQKLSFEERLRVIINGGRLADVYYPKFEDILVRISGWFEMQRAFVVKYENLVGAQGGGDDDLQRDTIGRVLEYLGVEASTSRIESIARDLYGGTHTFRKGKTDTWKDVLKPDMAAAINRLLEANPFLADLDYAV